jgi:hypothetical protein
MGDHIELISREVISREVISRKLMSREVISRKLMSRKLRGADQSTELIYLFCFIPVLFIRSYLVISEEYSREVVTSRLTPCYAGGKGC